MHPTLANLMSFELVWKHGGFYIDIDFLPLQKGFLNKLLKHEFVVPAAPAGLQRSFVDNRFFGCTKGNANILKMLYFPYLGSKNIYSKQPDR